MPTRGRGISPQEFEDRLRRGALAPPASITGMVRASDRAGNFQLSVDSCQTWVDIPLDAVEDAEVLGRRGCGDHSHPVVRFGLAEPRDSDPWERHLLVRSLAFNDPFDEFPGSVRTKTGTTDAGTENPCRDCVRRCNEVIGDAEAFRDCIRNCPC
jgi:hypothetical protein